MTGPRALHATTVALGEDRGLLVLGPSGSGKSALALQLMALGARLVADDQTLLTLQDGAVIATCPAAIPGRIEARGLGILRADPLPRARLILAVDLGHEETERLPPLRHITLLGQPIALVHGQRSAHFPSSLLCYLSHGRDA